MAIGNIKTWVRLFMPGQKRPQRIDNGAFSHVVGPDQNVQPGLKFQCCVTQLAEVFYGEFSEVHEDLHP
ncbi:hypothetical protein D3C77_585940 [compost metagenome]